MASKEIFAELEKRRHGVENHDLELRTKNREKFLKYWLHMTILSSAIVIGTLPLLQNNPLLIQSVTLAKTGLGMIVSVCVASIVYLHGVLNRERELLGDQLSFHRHSFAKQRGILEEAAKDGVNDADMETIFRNTKATIYSAEQDLILEHLAGSGIRGWLRRKVDRYINSLITYGFALGVGFIIFSFVTNDIGLLVQKILNCNSF